MPSKLSVILHESKTSTKNTEAWAVKAVNFATIKGWFKGNDQNMFNPQGNATRAELAQVLYNMLGRVR